MILARNQFDQRKYFHPKLKVNLYQVVILSYLRYLSLLFAPSVGNSFWPFSRPSVQTSPPRQYSKLFFITNLRELPPQSDPLWLTNLQQLLQSFPRLPSLPPLPFLLSVDGKSTTSSRQTPRWAASDCLQACQELSVGTAGADPGGRWRHGFYISRPVLWLAAVRVLKLHPKATSSLLRDVRMSTTHVKKNPSNWTYTCPRRSRRPCRPLTCNHTCRSRRTHAFTQTHTSHPIIMLHLYTQRAETLLFCSINGGRWENR